MNYLAVLIGAVINMVVGALWYSPVLFSKPWMKMIGKSESELKKGGMGKMYSVSFVCALILSYMLMRFMLAWSITTLTGGLMLAFEIWLGFVVTTTISDYLFAGRPIKLFAINTGYYLVVLLLVGGVFSIWH